MELTNTIKDIFRSISGRANKYKEFGLSRHEYEKYGVSENKMRSIINEMYKDWLIEKIRCEKYRENGAPRRRNIWIVTDKFLSIIQTITKSISDLNTKIIDWCKKQNPVQVLREHGIFVANNGRIGDKKSKITINKRNWSITNWKTWDKSNLFNYLRDNIWCDTIYFFTHFIWK